MEIAKVKQESTGRPQASSEKQYVFLDQNQYLQIVHLAKINSVTGPSILSQLGFSSETLGRGRRHCVLKISHGTPRTAFTLNINCFLKSVSGDVLKRDFQKLGVKQTSLNIPLYPGKSIPPPFGNEATLRRVFKSLTGYNFLCVKTNALDFVHKLEHFLFFSFNGG